MSDEPTSGVDAGDLMRIISEASVVCHQAGYHDIGQELDEKVAPALAALATPAASPAKATSDFVDARTAFEAANRGLPMDWVDDLCSGYRDAHTQSRWLGWKACWKRVETLSYALDQMRGPLSTAALIARAERAEALATPSPAPAALSALATVSGERQD